VKPKRFDQYASQIRMLAVLVLVFAVVPGALLLSVGVLVLVFGRQAHDTVFGVLILALAATLIAGISAILLYVRRGTSLARLQAEFVRNVSHDLRTPLTSIRMFVETLRDGRVSDPERIRECFEVLGRETQRLTAMVERLLEWARMEAGKRVYRPLPVRAGVLVDAALAALEGQVKLRQLEKDVVLVRERVADDVIVDADVDALTEALLNVLHNALVYTGARKEITVSTAAREREVCITVADNGPGIPKREQRRIFEKFHRVVDPANPDVPGAGLGLAMVHHILRAHRGRVTVESEPGRGAAFHLWVPMAAGEGQASGCERVKES
jgi:two-component system phosphate regulon sensor histidine kinase PhoR